MIAECPICTHGVDPDMPGCVQWRDQPVHTGCHDVLAQALTSYEPVLTDRHHAYDPDHKPVVYSWVGVTFQQYDCNWVKLPDDIKERIYDDYLYALNKTLDHYQDVVLAYCMRNGLGQPQFIREIKQEKNSMAELGRLLRSDKLKPGDHLVMATLPRSMHHKHMSAQLVMNMARKLAKKGVTFHSAYAGIDWSRPLSQHVVRMALNIQLWQNTIYKINMDIERGGRVFKLEGRTWREIQEDHVFQWIVRHIRDKKMSPRELYLSSQRFWTVYARVSSTKWKSVYITRKKRMAALRKSQRHYYCRSHNIVSLRSECPACGRTAYAVHTVASKGVWIKPRREFVYHVDDYVRAWAFYLQYHPDQDKKPWESRSKFSPEHLELKDSIMSDN